jgi:hypothetical protein
MTTVGPLEIGEIKALRFDFSTEADDATTLLSPVVTVSLLSGVDPTPSSVKSGSPTLDGKELVQIVVPGVAGCVYKVDAFVQDSSGLRHHMSARMSVVPG